MVGKWEIAEEVLNSVTFAVEFTIFTMFIYEEAMQIVCREFLNFISIDEKKDLKSQIRLRFDIIMADFNQDFTNYGILALYGCNAYSSYLFSCMMVKEWSYLYLGWDRLEYSFPRTGLF